MQDMTQFNPLHPTEAELRQIDIHQLLPQREPFVMVERLTGIDETLTVTETTVAPDNIFVERGHLSAPGLMENIAQTCAVRIGYVNKYILKKGIQIGYIGAVRDFRAIALPPVGATITTEVVVREQVFGMMLAEATVRIGGEVAATTSMKIAVREEVGE